MTDNLGLASRFRAAGWPLCDVDSMQTTQAVSMLLAPPMAMAWVVALLGAFATLELIGRSRRARRSLSTEWLLWAALSLGTTLWAVHVIGVSARPGPVEITFWPWGSFGAWVAGFLAGLAGLGWATARSVPVAAIVAGSGVLSLGVVAVQITAMLTLDPAQGINWRFPILWMALPVAWLGIGLALALLLSKSRVSARRRLCQQGLATVLMGVALVVSQWIVADASGFEARSQPIGADQVSASVMSLIAASGSIVVLLCMSVMSLLQSRMESSVREARDELQRQSLRDPLTRLPNRLLFEGTLAQAVQQAGAASGRLALLFIGIDGFKHINQSFGHRGGDRVLCAITARLRSLASPHMVARVGGDEFVMLLSGNPAESEASSLAVRVQESLNRPIALNGQETMVACSIGIAMYPEHGAPSTLIAHADAAMRESKAAGGATFCFFEARMVAGARDQAMLLRDLRRALRKNQFELYYQPKVDGPSGKITGAEALIRWHHPQRGMISPDVFIPMAERYGLIGPLGLWVIDDACRQIREWRDAGLRMRVAVNLSQHQLRDPEVAVHVAAAIRKHGINPKLLTCEITESVAMQDSIGAMKLFSALAAVGVHISIDDFGTGYSSLAYLRKLPAEEIKIDRSFVLDLETSDDARSVVDAVVRLGQALHLKVVAEGVETEAQYEILRNMGCHELQGYLFARPMSARAMAVWALDEAKPSPLEFRSSLFRPSTTLVVH